MARNNWEEVWTGKAKKFRYIAEEIAELTHRISLEGDPEGSLDAARKKLQDSLKDI